MGGSHRLEGRQVTAGIDRGLSEVGPSKELPHFRLVCTFQVLLFKRACLRVSPEVREVCFCQRGGAGRGVGVRLGGGCVEKFMHAKSTRKKP